MSVSKFPCMYVRAVDQQFCFVLSVWEEERWTEVFRSSMFDTWLAAYLCGMDAVKNHRAASD